MSASVGVGADKQFEVLFHQKLQRRREKRRRMRCCVWQLNRLKQRVVQLRKRESTNRTSHSRCGPCCCHVHLQLWGGTHRATAKIQCRSRNQAFRNLLLCNSQKCHKHASDTSVKTNLDDPTFTSSAPTAFNSTFNDPWRCLKCKRLPELSDVSLGVNPVRIRVFSCTAVTVVLLTVDCL